MTTYLPFLIELRQRTIRVLVVFLAWFCLLFLFAKESMAWFLRPLMRLFTGDQGMIAIHMTSPVLAPLSLAMDLALLLTLPFVLFELWRFVAPALYFKERRVLSFWMVMSFVMLLLGALFAYEIVLPYLFLFFKNSVPNGVAWQPDLRDALGFMTRMMVIFALFFQVPLGCLLLIKTRLLRYSHLKLARPYVIVSAFVLGMLLTPPDVLSQCILAIPLWFLYEFGILLAWLSIVIGKQHSHAV